MIERLIVGVIDTSVAGGLSILAFCCLSWILKRKYGARSRKNGWLLIAVCLLLPLDMASFPYTHTVQLPNLVVRGTAESAAQTGSSEPQSEQKTNTVARSLQDETHGTEISTENILFLSWLAGMLLLTAYHLLMYWKMCGRVKRWGRACQDKTIQKIAADIAMDLGLKKVPKIRIIESGGPFTIGITANIVCLPDEDFLEKDLYYILKHELIHCKERDILWKLLLLTVNIIHWFNPFVWLLRRLAENDIEQVCDESVLRNASKEERREYSEIIMARVEKSGQRQSPVATGYMTGMVFLRWRFANIFDSDIKRNGAVLLGGMCILIVLFGGAVNIGASETIYQTSSIPIDFGIESRTDLDGDGKEDRVRTMDDEICTQIVANVNGVDVAIKDYEGHYSSTVVTGDLSGNGRADVLSIRHVFTSNYGSANISILHLEGTELVEYPYHFIPNPDIDMRCPVSFEPDESWMNGDLYVGATLFEKNGKTMVRFILLDYEESDEDIVRVIEASYREEGWYIENVEVVDHYYTKDRYEDLLAPIYKISR